MPEFKVKVRPRADVSPSFAQEKPMRILKISAALALMAGSLGLTATADAHPYDGRHDRVERVAHRDDYRRDHRRYDRPRYDRRRYEDRRRNQWRRHEARRHHAYRNPRRCWTEWRHHRRIRVCR
jgi:hypothetical protein